MTDAFFVTGTDTGVGKTFIAGALARGLSDRGYRVGVLKPVESGCARVDGVLQAADALFLREMARSDAGLDVINPYAFEPPIASALAAEQAGVIIDFERIRACFEALSSDNDVVLVEGAGGLLAPVFSELDCRDLARYLGLPLLVVAANRLGVVNHATLTAEAARASRLEVAGIVLNDSVGTSDASTDSNATSLQRWSGAPVLFSAPHFEEANEGDLAALGDKLVSVLTQQGWLAVRPQQPSIAGERA